MYTYTGVKSGDCTNNVSYHMPAQTAGHTVVVTAKVSCVLKGIILQDMNFIIDGTHSYKWASSAGYN